MPHTETVTSPDYTGVQQAIEDQLQRQGWCDIHAEARGDRLIIEAQHLADMPGECADAPPRREARTVHVRREQEPGALPRWL